jgi:hypothetical protein
MSSHSGDTVVISLDGRRLDVAPSVQGELVQLVIENVTVLELSADSARNLAAHLLLAVDLLGH